MNQDFFSEFDKEDNTSMGTDLTGLDPLTDSNHSFQNDNISGAFFNDIEKINVNEIKNTSGISKYRCRDCKNIMITGDKINICPFCNSINLDINDYNGELNSTVVLDFNKTLDDALKDYKKKVFNPLVPFKFKNKKVYDSISKLYVVASLNDVNVHGTVKFLALDNIAEGKKSTKKNKYEVDMTTNFDYKNIIVNGINSIDDKMFAYVCEGDFLNIKTFDSSYLKDSSIILGNLTQDEINKKVETVAINNSLNMMKEEVKHELKKVTDNNLIISYLDRKNILIPVYQVNINYKGKDYLYLMNGNTGKSYIKLVYSLSCLITFSLIVFIVVFLVALLIVYFF